MKTILGGKIKRETEMRGRARERERGRKSEKERGREIERGERERGERVIKRKDRE